MSQFRKYQAQVLKNVDKELLKEACADLGFGFDETTKKINNTYGNSAVDAALVRDGRKLPIGFRFVPEGTNTKLEVEGDFYGTGINSDTFVDQVSQAYSKIEGLTALRSQGFTYNKIETLVDGTIEIILERWAA